MAPPTTDALFFRRSMLGLVTPDLVALAHDPQTSGSLLAAVPRTGVEALVAAFHAAGVEHWWRPEMSLQVSLGSAWPDSGARRPDRPLVLAQWRTRTFRSTTPTPIPQSTSATRNASPAACVSGPTDRKAPQEQLDETGERRGADRRIHRDARPRQSEDDAGHDG